MKNKVIAKKKKKINSGSCGFKTLEDLSSNLINQDMLPIHLPSSFPFPTASPQVELRYVYTLHTSASPIALGQKSNCLDNLPSLDSLFLLTSEKSEFILS